MPGAGTIVRVMTVRRALLLCGVLSSLLYVAMNVIVPARWPAYSSVSQTVSELSAIGAPTRSLWAPLAYLYTALVAAFAWGVWRSADGSRPLRIVGALLGVYAALGLLWPLAPMHQRAVLAAGGGTMSDTMHLALGGVTVLLMLMTIGFGAAAFGRVFRVYSIATIVVLLVFGLLTAVGAPAVSANQPTPLIGVWERINISVFLLWVVIVAMNLPRDTASAG